MKIDVGENIVEPIIKEQVAAAIAAQLGDPAKIISNIVEQTLSSKVDSEGRPSRYNSPSDTSYIEFVCRSRIKEAAKQAIIQFVERCRPEIQKAVEDQLKRSPKKTAAAIVAAFAETCGNTYRVNANFEIINGRD